MQYDRAKVSFPAATAEASEHLHGEETSFSLEGIPSCCWRWFEAGTASQRSMIDTFPPSMSTLMTLFGVIGVLLQVVGKPVRIATALDVNALLAKSSTDGCSSPLVDTVVNLFGASNSRGIAKSSRGSEQHWRELVLSYLPSIDHFASP